MNKILRYFPLNKGVEEKNKGTLIKLIGLYILIWIASYIVMRLFGRVPLIGNLLYRVFRVWEYYVLAGMALGCYQCFNGKDFSSVTYIGKEDLKRWWSYKQCKIAVIAAALVLALIPRGGRIRTQQGEATEQASAVVETKAEQEKTGAETALEQKFDDSSKDIQEDLGGQEEKQVEELEQKEENINIENNEAIREGQDDKLYDYLLFSLEGIEIDFDTTSYKIIKDGLIDLGYERDGAEYSRKKDPNVDGTINTGEISEVNVYRLNQDTEDSMLSYMFIYNPNNLVLTGGITEHSSIEDVHAVLGEPNYVYNFNYDPVERTDYMSSHSECYISKDGHYWIYFQWKQNEDGEMSMSAFSIHYSAADSNTKFKNKDFQESGENRDDGSIAMLDNYAMHRYWE